MASNPQAGIPAFTSWLSQISSSLRSLGQNGPNEVSVKDESLTSLSGSTTDSFDYSQSLERLTPIGEEPDELESQRSLLLDSTGSESVNSYGEDGEVSSSSGSEDELAKHFEISVSRSQSFRSGVPELSTPNAPGKHHKFKRLLSDQEEGGTEPSDCEDAERGSVHSFQDPLRVRRQTGSELRNPLSSQSPEAEGHPLTDPLSQIAEEISMGYQDTEDGVEALPIDEPSRPYSAARHLSQRSLALDNQGYDNSEATKSSTEWSVEHDQSLSHPLSSSSSDPISKCGDLIISLDYRAEANWLLLTVIMAQGIPDKARSGMDSWQVHVVLLPGKRQRYKTAVQKGSMPRFEESFRFSQLEPGDLDSSALRFRLYALGKMNRERMMGEALYRLSRLKHSGPFESTLVLVPRANLKSLDSQSSSFSTQTDSASTSQSVSHGGNPELMLGLSYNATTGRLSVEIIKGSHFRNFALNRPPDTFCKLTLLNSMGQEISRCKTSLRRSQPNPVFKETFVFQVALFQLSDVTLMVSVYNRRNMKRKEMIGWVALGQNSSGEEELLHWQDMKESGTQQVCRWHTLLEA
ncbi:hypothetical protein DNTS_002837 [Danionella cerebrum]|uniref:C2 domain-containing protein n=1 Tax=Danionella cerebrum TaxID=2873325 RepID=A0A553RG68_9TELE|nr:hypothetical protein DNTS_002837 [Danionella translucida]